MDKALVAILLLGGYLLSGCGGGSATPPPAATLSVTVPSATVTAGTPFNITVSALNASGTVATTYSGTIHFTSSDPQAALPSNSTLTNGTGMFSVTVKTSGSQTITAADTVKTSISGTSNSINVSPAFPPPPPKGIVGQPYGGAQSITIGGCALNFVGWPLEELDVPPTGHPWSWTAAQGSSLPPGLAISAASRSCGIGVVFTVSAWLVGGVPTTAGTYNVILTGPPGTANYTITISAPTSAAAATEASGRHHHYKLIDMGTFGGPASSINFPFFAGTLDNRGMTVGWSATPVPTLPTSSFLICGGIDGVVPFITHAFQWNGTVKDLGTFAPSETNCSEPFFMNSKGEVVGASETADIDPQFFDLQQIHGVLWKDGQMIDLGSLGGHQVAAFGINDRGQIIGNSTNTIPDPFCFFGTVQNRMFLWEQGQMRDIGTLGGNCAGPGAINERGQVVGNSATSANANPLTGFPTTDPFLWEEGKGMMDLGSLGGAFGSASSLNNGGQIVGQSSIASDPGACNGFPDNNNLNCHAFLWDQGSLLDLTTSSIGGSPEWIAAINDAGDIVGWGSFPSSTLEAFLWRNGVATDLGNLGGCGSFSQSINFQSQIVGGAFSCDAAVVRAFLWEDGSIVDLNTLIPAGSNLQLAVARNINDRGEIVGDGVPPGAPPNSFAFHGFLLIPCDENHPDIEGCDYSLVDASTGASEEKQTAAKPALTPEAIQRFMRSFGPRSLPWRRGFGPQPVK